MLISIISIKRYSIDFIILILLILLNVTMSILFYNTEINDVFRSLLAYLNVLFAMLIVNKHNYIKFIYLIRGILIFLLVLGILQYFGLLSSIDFIFKALVPRASAESLYFENRGVTLLSSEPARAGNLLIFLYISYRMIFIKSFKIRFYLDMIFLVYLFIIIKSAMAAMFYLLFLVIVYRVKIILPIFFMLIIISFINVEHAGRVLDLFKSLSEMDNLYEVLTVLINTSGHRLLSIYAFYNYAFINIFGGGIGNWMNSSVEALYYTGYDLSNMNYFIRFGAGDAVGIRGSGFITNFALDTGLIGLFIFFRYLFGLFKVYWSISEDTKIVIIIFIIKILFVGSVGHPVAWITTIATLKYLYFKRKEG
jgi:hypothetical protein